MIIENAMHAFQLKTQKTMTIEKLVVPFSILCTEFKIVKNSKFSELAWTLFGTVR